MSTVIFKKDGPYLQRVVYDDLLDREIHQEERLVGENIFRGWHQPVEFADDTTFGAIVAWVRSLDERNFNVLGCLLDGVFLEWMSDFEKNTSKESEIIVTDDDSLTAIEIMLSLEVDNYEEKALPECCAEWIVSGVGAKRDEYSGELIRYAIEFTPWAELFDLPVRLRNAVLCETTWKPDVFNCGSVDMSCTVRNSDGEAIGEFTRKARTIENITQREVRHTPKFGEVLHALFFELCWFASKESRDAEVAELKSRLDEALTGDAALVELKSQLDAVPPGGEDDGKE